MEPASTFLPRFFDRGNPPLLDQGKRSGTLSLKAIQAIAAENSDFFKVSKGRVALGLVFLWHDHWEEAHKIAQFDEGEFDHDLLHAIVHRRENDFANSAYWFREAGENVAFEILSPRASKLLMDSASEIIPEKTRNLRDKIVPDGKWNPFGFLDTVKSKKFESLSRALQAEEIIAFFEVLTA